MTVEVQAKKLDVSPGDLVESGDRHYEIVPDGGGGVSLEPAVTRSVAELRAARGGTGGHTLLAAAPDRHVDSRSTIV